MNLKAIDDELCYVLDLGTTQYNNVLTSTAGAREDVNSQQDNTTTSTKMSSLTRRVMYPKLGGRRRSLGRPHHTIPVTLAQLEDIAKEHGTPFQLYDESAIRSNVPLLQASPSTSGFTAFAVKALPNPAPQNFAEEGCGLDCSPPLNCTLRQN